jgi:hypothetical protein
LNNGYKVWLKSAFVLTLLVILISAPTSSISAQRKPKPKRGNNEKSYGNYGGSELLRKTEIDNGYAEGIREGRTDRSRGERFVFTDEESYRSAIKGYSSRLGDKSLYQRYFRAAFGNGYREGWNGY